MDHDDLPFDDDELAKNGGARRRKRSKSPKTKPRKRSASKAKKG